MVFFIQLIFAGGTGVLEKRKGSAFVGDMTYYGGGNYSFNWGKWSIWVREIGHLSKKIQGRSIM